MALTQENPGIPTTFETERAFRDASLKAKQWAQQLTVQHNPEPMDPKRSREARNPAHPGNVVIRIQRPAPVRIAVADIDAVYDHNEFVSSLGQSGKKWTK